VLATILVGPPLGAVVVLLCLLPFLALFALFSFIPACIGIGDFASHKRLLVTLAPWVIGPFAVIGALLGIFSFLVGAPSTDWRRTNKALLRYSSRARREQYDTIADLVRRWPQWRWLILDYGIPATVAASSTEESFRANLLHLDYLLKQLNPAVTEARELPNSTHLDRFMRGGETTIDPACAYAVRPLAFEQQKGPDDRPAYHATGALFSSLIPQAFECRSQGIDFTVFAACEVGHYSEEAYTYTSDVPEYDRFGNQIGGSTQEVTGICQRWNIDSPQKLELRPLSRNRAAAGCRESDRAALPLMGA
jgi:hypothetical protein